MVEKFLQGFAKWLQERGGKWEREAAARLAWGHAPALPSLLYRRGGAALAPPPSPRAGGLRELVPQVSPLRVLGASHLCGRMGL